MSTEIFNALPRKALDHLNRLAEMLMREPANQRIGRNGSPYIDRWMLSRKAAVPTYDRPGVPVGEYGSIPSLVENIYLHSYHRADADDPHDHPWANASLVIRGSYQETLCDAVGNPLSSTERRPGDIVLRAAKEIHAITKTSGDCLSFFATFRKEREWGFWLQGLFVPWPEYHRHEHEVTGTPTIAAMEA